MNLRRFVAGSSALFGARLGSALLQVSIGVLLARQLSVGEVAVYFYFFNTALIGGLLVNMGVGVAGIRFISARDNAPLEQALAVRKVIRLSLMLAAAFVGFAAAVGVSGLWAVLSGLPGFAEFGTWVVMWIAFNSIRVACYDCLLATGHPAQAALFSGLLSACLTVAGVAVWTVAGGTLSIHAVIAIAVSSAAVAATASVLVGMVHGRVSKRAVEASQMRPESAESLRSTTLIRAGIPLMLSTSLSSRRKETLVAVLGVVSTSEAVVLLGITNQIVAVVAMPVVAVTGMIMPEIARASGRGRLVEESRRLRTLWTVTLVPVLAIAVLLIVLSERVITLGYGATYAGTTAVAVVSIMGRIISILAGPTSQTLAMTGRHNVLLGLSAIEFIPLVAMGALLGHRFGALGGAWAFTLSVTLVSLLSTAYIRKYLGMWVFAWIFPGERSHAHEVGPAR